MFNSSGTFARRAIAVAASATLLAGLATAPAQAATPEPVHHSVVAAAPSELSSQIAADVQTALFVLVGFPIVASSVLSSAIGIPQCGLHDTRGC